MKRAKSIIPNQEFNDDSDKFLNSLNNFNLFDIILRVSALNLLPYNQNKSLVLDKIINDILTYGFDSYNSENLMSMSRFRNLINQYMNSGLALSIDPAEMPFIQRVQFYGDYWILTGINTNIGYNLQSLIDVLFKHEKEFNREFLDKCNRMTHSILTITNDIVTGLGYGIETLGHYERTDVDIPSSGKLTELTDSLIVNIEAITTVLQDEVDVLFYNFDNYSTFSEHESTNNFLFFYAPLLKINEKEAIILDPTILPTFLIYYILKEAKEYDLFQEVIIAYNNEIWEKCHRYLRDLEIKKINEAAEGVELVNNKNYKESVFCLSSSKLLFVRFFCDDGSDYNCNEMFAFVSNNTQPNSSRWDYIQKSFDKCSPEDFYSLNIINTFGILIINHKNHHIIVGEVKDFSFTKNAYEMYQEYQNVFCDNGSKLCYISKHKRRVKWVEEHISDVIMQYNLPKANWTVRDVLITNDVIVSNEIYHKKQKILLYSMINEKSLMKL